MEPNQVSVAPRWNIVSVTLPVVGAVIVMAVVKASSPGDYASGIGSVLKAVIALGVVCVLGEAAAIAALVRGEKMTWLSILGTIVNIVVILPAIYLATRIE